MATDKIKLNYPQAEKMAKTFHEGAKELEQIMREMEKIATTLDQGALLGRGGQGFSDALRGKLCPSIKKLSAKFQELEKDVNGAISDMKRADSESKQQFT